MSDIISRQAAIDEILEALNGVPTAVTPTDAVYKSEIVRCGECKHMTPEGRCLEFADDNLRPSASDFCSYAERRESEKNTGCAECLSSFGVVDDETEQFNFCPVCDADMGEGQDDNNSLVMRLSRPIIFVLGLLLIFAGYVISWTDRWRNDVR